VRWVAGIRASVHTKLLGGFLLVTLLFITLAVVSLLALVSATHQSQLLDQAHERVSWSQQIEYALARQMHFTTLALLAKDEAAIAKILRENNRFNNMLPKLEVAGTAEQNDLIEQVRSSQDDAMEAVADMANAIRDGKLGGVTGALLKRLERLDDEITMRVGRLVEMEQNRMARLRDSVNDANRRSLVLTIVFAVSAVILALLCGFVISWTFILPVREAQRFLGHVAAGNFGGSITVPNRDEFGALADSLNHMSQELRRIDEEQRRAAADLTQSLEQQTATAEILKVISSSPTDLKPVFDCILDNATRLCDAHLGVLYGSDDGEKYQTLAQRGASDEFAKYLMSRESFVPAPGSAMRKMITERQPAHLADYKETVAYRERAPNIVALVELGGVRTFVIVPMLKEGRVVGGVAIYRREVRPFSQKQVDLLRSFADQAVIAIENVRLFNEVKARTEALTRSVEEMRALGEVGQAVSSTLDLDTVLMTIISHAVELSKADAGGTIYEFDETTEIFEPRASHGVSESYVNILRGLRIRLGETAVGMCAANRSPYQVPDLEKAEDNRVRETLLREGIRAVLAVPLLREQRVIGALVIRRKVAGEFSQSVVSLLQTFAGQSVLAIQNARLFQEVREKSHELEVASQLKSQFLANMSHELRTPLNAIIGYSEMLQEEAVELGAKQFVADLKKIHASGQHLLELINSVLDLAKIESGKMDLYLESFNVASVVAGVSEVIQPLAQKKSNRLEVECAENVDTMHADLTKVRQTLFNLLSNACKFTENGTVTLSVEREHTEGGDWMVFHVRDTGIGLTPEQMGRLFQEFSQADASTTRKYGGTGLGLALSRRLCQLMGGDITVQSEPGRGSRFTLRLPAEVKDPATAMAAEEAAARPRPDTEGALVLVVDDDAAVRETMEHFLTREGYSVATASGGREALRLARELRPAAITLDVMMPDLDGWTVLSALKGDPELADIPAILVSIVDEKKRGYSLGAAEYMVKPIDRKRLVSALRSICHPGARNILVVDDDDALRASVVRTLSDNGWNVSEAANGKAALLVLGDARPDAIVLDLMMPEMDGFEFLAAIRARAEWLTIPVIVVTAKDLTDEDRRCLSGGVEHIFQKSARSREEFLGELARALAVCVGRTRTTETADPGTGI